MGIRLSGFLGSWELGVDEHTPREQSAARRIRRSLRSPGQQFAPAQLTRTGKNAPSALPLATRAGSPTQRGHHAAGAFYAIKSRPLTLTCANRCPGSRADLDHTSKDDALPSRAVPVLGGRARLERATCSGASLRHVAPKPIGAGKPARRFLAASSVSVIRVDPTPPPAHQCA